MVAKVPGDSAIGVDGRMSVRSIWRGRAPTRHDGMLAFLETRGSSSTHDAYISSTGLNQYCNSWGNTRWDSHDWQ